MARTRKLKSQKRPIVVCFYCGPFRGDSRLDQRAAGHATTTCPQHTGLSLEESNRLRRALRDKAR